MAAAVTIGINAAGLSIPKRLYAAIFVWIGVMVAGYRAWASLHAAWETHRDKASRLAREAEAVPRPILSLHFDPSDPQCVRNGHGTETFWVGVKNEGTVRAEDVRSRSRRSGQPLGRWRTTASW